MYPGSVHSTHCRPTMNIREWVPHQSLGPDCPWCKAVLAHHGPTVLSSNEVCSSNLWKVNAVSLLITGSVNPSRWIA